MIFGWLKRKRRDKILSQPFPDAWRPILAANVPHYDLLSEEEQSALRDALRIFVAEISWEGCGGLTITDEIKVTVAAQACLLVIGMEHDYFSHVPTVLVYPTAYKIPKDEYAHGEVVNEESGRLGEAWYRGPVVLAWDEVLIGGQNFRDGRNVAIHEFAHQLDFMDGWIDGTPPLKDRDQYQKWQEVTTAAYEGLVEASRKGKATLLDDYGATNPAEFFAVAAECFFEKPIQMERRHSLLYEVLRDYFAQDTAERFRRQAKAEHSRTQRRKKKGKRKVRHDKKEIQAMKCPRDGATLETKTWESLIEPDESGLMIVKDRVEIDACPKCGGTWLDNGELERIQTIKDRDYSETVVQVHHVANDYQLARQKALPNIKCPSCDRTMDAKEYPDCKQMLIDVCPGCKGLWLDAGELEALEKLSDVGSRMGFFAGLTNLFPLYGLGKITAQFVRNGKPLRSRRYKVKAFDKDPLKDDLLAERELADEGRLQCTFDLYDIVSADSPLEKKPDIYLVLLDGEDEIFRTPVFPNLDFQNRDPNSDGSPIVTHDLGTFEVGEPGTGVK